MGSRGRGATSPATCAGQANALPETKGWTRRPRRGLLALGALEGQGPPREHGQPGHGAEAPLGLHSSAVRACAVTLGAAHKVLPGKAQGITSPIAPAIPLSSDPSDKVPVTDV
eukprot:11168475-Lingulodinium_polyedra.AAC.1